MEKTLKLLDMGFSENEVSAVIEKYGEQIISLLVSIPPVTICLLKL